MSENFKPPNNLDIGTRYGANSRCFGVTGERFVREMKDVSGVSWGWVGWDGREAQGGGAWRGR